MTKVVLNDVSNLQTLTSSASTINANNNVLETASDNTLSRDGTSPNQMMANFDMNSNQILNLPSPATVNSPARLIDVVSNPTINVPPVGTSGATVPLLNGNNTWSGTQTFNPAPVYQVPANTVQGNNTGSTANIASLTQTQLTAMVNPVTSALKGLAPASGGGTTNFLRADATWAAPSFVSNTAWTNTTLLKTNTYTVLNADKGSTLFLGGGIFYTVTLNAAGGYDANFAILITNGDTARGKRITASGISTFILYPGQSCWAYIANGVWNIPPPGRWQKASAQLYVDNVNGNDTNDGLAISTGAFKTIGAATVVAVNNIDCQNGPPIINISAGTYTEAVNLEGQISGVNVLYLTGAGSSSVTWKPVGFCLLVGDNAEVIVSGIKFDNTSGSNDNTAVALHQTGVLDLAADINFGTFPGSGSSHISSDHGGFMNISNSYTISGNVGTHMIVGPGTQITQSGGITVAFSGTPTITTMYKAVNAGIAFAGVVTYTGAPAAGTTKYSIDNLAVFASGGSTLPGTIAGLSGHGSQFI